MVGWASLAIWNVKRCVQKATHGGNPTILPVPLPTRFESVVDVKTAKALGLAISCDFPMRADGVLD
jgi:putative tryptophan/tyrosine transport system substrate-binding protein